jgi:predicted 2-oxoglutarate/Fe(II)-dependent dioxygenase YbiX|tara:strand:- start:2940 stop:3593 length:654 start_codon:yes stop_codon:yes gene_type:complete
MRYEFISDNVIKSDNFLPPEKIDFIYSDLLNTRSNFGIPRWSADNSQESEVQSFSHNCGNTDYWIDDKNTGKIKTPNIKELHKYFFQQGLNLFIQESGKKSIYSMLYEYPLVWSIHVTAYNKGDYYNWHKDSYMTFKGVRANMFTFNYMLKSNSSSLKGGNLLVRDSGEHEIESKNNQLVIFPGFIPHAVTPIQSEKEVSFLEQRFSIQYWIGFKEE